MTDSKVARNLEVLIVRHGESENNIIMEEVFARTYAQPFSSEEFQKADKEWLARRSEDPSLSAKGMAEAEQFAHANVPKLLEAVGPTGCVHIFVSPLLRTCQTAWPLVKLLGSEHCKVEVRPDIYEVLVYIQKLVVNVKVLGSVLVQKILNHVFLVMTHQH